MVIMGLKPKDLVGIVKAERHDDVPEDHLSDFLHNIKRRKDGGDWLGWSHDFPQLYDVRERDPETGKHVDVRRRMRDITGLDRVAEGAGWTQNTRAPQSMRYENIPVGEPEDNNPPVRIGKPVYEPPLEDGADEDDPSIADWMKQYDEWEPDAIRSLSNTIRHEAGHGATKNLYDMVRDTGNQRSTEWRPLAQNNRSVERPNQDKEEAKTMRMLAELDDSRLATRRLKEPSYLDPMFRRGEKEFWGPSAWHEYAAYLAELPNHPSYALGKWLKHSHVEQAQRRSALKRLAEAQKKWGEEPIDWKKIAGAFSPKADYWDRKEKKQVTDIMGDYPQLRPPMPLGERVDDSDWQPEYSDPEKAKKFLMPAGERIYRNLREAIVGQSYGTLAAAKDFDVDPEGIANQDKYQSARVKMAEKHGASALKLLNQHFAKVRQGKEQIPQTIKDLPENLRGEIARLELRRILAEQVGEQNMMMPDTDWQDPDKTLDVGWSPRTTDYGFRRNYYGIDDDWMKELSDKIGLEDGLARPGNDAQYIPEDGAWGDLKRYINETLMPKPAKWEEANPEVGKWGSFHDDYEATRAKYNDDEEAWRAASDKHGEDYRASMTQYITELQDEMERLGLGEYIKNRVGDTDEWGGTVRDPSIKLPYYYPPRMFNPEGRDSFVEYDKDPNAPVQIDDSTYGASGVGTRANIPTSYYGLIPKRAARDLNANNRSYVSDYPGYGDQGNMQWRKDEKPISAYNARRMNTVGYDPVFDTWMQDDPDNWEDHPLAGKLQMTPNITGFTNPNAWALETKYPWKKRRNWESHRSGVIDSPFDKEINDQMIDAERKRLEEAGQHVPARWRYEHTWEGNDEDGNYYQSNEDSVHFKRRGGKEREQPFKRTPMPRYEWDPVARAIAQAFMDREMEKVPGELNQQMKDNNKERVARAMKRNEQYYADRGKGPEDLAREWDKKPSFAMRPRNLPITGKKWRGEIPITPSDIPDFDSELTDIAPIAEYNQHTIQDKTLPRYSLRSFMEGNPQTNRHGGTLINDQMPRRKTLNELLSEMAEARREKAGYPSWDRLDHELRNRELEDED